jgi:hypothetical protein
VQIGGGLDWCIRKMTDAPMGYTPGHSGALVEIHRYTLQH